MRILLAVLFMLQYIPGSADQHIASIDAEVNRIDSLCGDFIHPLEKHNSFDSLYALNFTDTVNGVTRHWYNGGDCYYHSTYKKGEDIILCAVILANAEQRYYYKNNRLIKYVYHSRPGEICISIAYGYHEEMYFRGRRLILKKEIVPLPEEYHTRKSVLRESRWIYRYSRNFDTELAGGVGA